MATPNSDNNKALVHIARDKIALRSAFHTQIIRSCTQAITSRENFVLAISGGSLPSLLSGLNESFAAVSVNPQYKKWHIILVDERLVAEDHPDSNMGSIKNNFLSSGAASSIPPDQILTIDYSKLRDDGVDKAAASAIASCYGTALKNILDSFSSHRIDLCLLGFGEDGHTASIFPDHPLLAMNDKDTLVAYIQDSPKPPPFRTTLTLPTLNSSREILFVGTGAGKQKVIDTVFIRPTTTKIVYGAEDVAILDLEMVDPPQLPCAMVRLDGSRVKWLIDANAAGNIIGKCKGQE